MSHFSLKKKKITKILIKIAQLFFHHSRAAVILPIKNIDLHAIPLILGNKSELAIHIASACMSCM